MTKETVDQEIFEAIMELAKRRGDTPLNKCPGLWNVKLSGGFELWANPQKEQRKTSGGIEVGPFQFYVEYNGWPFAMFHPMTGGSIGNGGAANSESFLAALRCGK